MLHPLLDCPSIDLPPAQYLSSVGTVFTEFGAQTQDSGNISYGIQIGEERFFVKTAGNPGDTRPFLVHSERVVLLRNAIRLQGSFQHPLLPKLQQFIESPDGPMLIYPWLDGELLGVPRERRDDPQSSFQRFLHLPASTILSCLDGIFDLHTKAAKAGWIAGDFYDGSLLYDFTPDRLWLVDLDSYNSTPFHNSMGQMFGSSRFMAPEEREYGALIDEQTTVYVMGRTALVFLSDGILDAEKFRGPKTLFKVAAQACAPNRENRFASMSDFFLAWKHSRPNISVV